ncbi:hypothetical protein ABIB26_001763 [Arthrobacter sp. UYEF20]
MGPDQTSPVDMSLAGDLRPQESDPAVGSPKEPITGSGIFRLCSLSHV